MVRYSYLLAFLLLCMADPVRAANTVTVFSPDSFWYTPIPRDAPLHPKSAAFVDEFLRQKKAFYGTVGINTTKYASPVYVAPPGTALQRVDVWDCQNKRFIDPGLSKQWEAVPIPDDAEPAGGTDGELTVYQPSTDRIWEFWQLRRNGSRWEACWGGMMTNASRNPGIWFHPYGTTATGLPFLGGQMGIDELRKGRIEHALGMALVETERAEILSWPATRSDGVNPTNVPNRIPQGLRFRLDPSVDVDRLQMHPVGKAIARAAQTYGFVVWDKAGALTLRGENPLPYISRGERNPYDEVFNGTPHYAILEGFPWEKLQFLAMDYGRP